LLQQQQEQDEAGAAASVSSSSSVTSGRPDLALLGAQPLGAQPLAAQPLAAQPLAAQPLGAQPLLCTKPTNAIINLHHGYGVEEDALAGLASGGSTIVLAVLPISSSQAACDLFCR
jgi:hypothetical protein